MTSNPMQKKARNSFLLGMVITLIICLTIGVLFYFLISSKSKKDEGERGEEVKAYVLNSDVKSGQIITADLLSQITVYQNMVPANYISNASISAMQLQDEDGNILQTTSDGKLFMNVQNNEEYKTISNNDKDKNKILIESDGSRYYKTKNNNDKEYIEFLNVPVVAKVNMYKNTILTSDVISKSDEVITDDVRYVEYNMLLLSTKVAQGDFIDIRLTLPNGLDLIVVSKKQIKSILGNTVGLELSEDEVTMLESAIMEAYVMTASKLYVAQYVEPGNQTAAIRTYVPTEAVQNLINSDVDGNLQRLAKETLVKRFENDGLRSYIDNSKNQYMLEEKENIEKRLEEEIENARAAREAYLSGLTSY